MSERPLNYAGFWDRTNRAWGFLNPVKTVIVDRQGIPATRSRHMVRDFINLLPLILFLLFAVARAWQTQDPINSLFNAFDSFQKLGGLIPYYFVFCVALNLPVLFSRTRRSIEDYVAGTFVVYKDNVPPSQARKFARFVLASATTILFALIALFCTWYFYNLPDRQLDPKYAQFFPADPFNPNKNFFVALEGIHAPMGATNLYAYGLNVVSKSSTASIEKGGLTFKGDATNICIHQARAEDNRTCLSAKQIDALLNDNSELLARYQALQGQTDLLVSKGDKFMFGHISSDVLNLQRLQAWKWIEEAQNGHGDQAIGEWMTSTQFAKRVLAGKMNMVDHAI